MLFILDSIGTLDMIRKISAPVIVKIVGLPLEAVDVFISTIIRREAGAGMLLQNFKAGNFNDVQTVVCLLIMTFLSPCVNSILIIIKELGMKVMAGIMCFVVPFSFLIGTIVNHACRFFNISFR